MVRVLIVAFGGALGSVARYLLTGAVQRVTTDQFPTGTLAVNVIGSFIVGFVAGLALERQAGIGPGLRLFLIMGFCGGFTTFSALSYETMELVRTGELVRAGLNAMGQLVLGLAAVWGGVALSRAL